MVPILKDYKFDNPNIFWDSMELADFKLPVKTRDIYFYLPYRMSEILPTIAMFGNIDLNSGKKIEDLYYESFRFQAVDNEFIELENGIKIDLKNGKMISADGNVAIKSLIYSVDGKTQTKKVFENFENGLNIIIVQDYGEVLVLDDFMLQSTFVKLFFLEDVNNNYFELVSKNIYAKIYKLKI